MPIFLSRLSGFLLALPYVTTTTSDDQAGSASHAPPTRVQTLTFLLCYSHSSAGFLGIVLTIMGASCGRHEQQLVLHFTLTRDEEEKNLNEVPEQYHITQMMVGSGNSSTELFFLMASSRDVLLRVAQFRSSQRVVLVSSGVFWI
jgi:hypothetical protein